MRRSKNLMVFARRNKILVALLSIALATALFFAFNVARDILYFEDPRHQDMELKGWMTPRYIALSYDLPRPVVFEILELTEGTARGVRLRDVAQDKGITMNELTEEVRTAAEEYREAQPSLM